MACRKCRVPGHIQTQSQRCEVAAASDGRLVEIDSERDCLTFFNRNRKRRSAIYRVSPRQRENLPAYSPQFDEFLFNKVF